MAKKKEKEPIYAIRVYCKKCGKMTMESARLTHKQLLVNWDDAVFKACSIYCLDCMTKPPVINDLKIMNYALNKVTPAPTHGQALEWLRRKNVYTSFYVEKCAETGKDTWAFQYFDRDLNLIATDSGINITNYNKCVELAIMFATKFLVR